VFPLRLVLSDFWPFFPRARLFFFYVAGAFFTHLTFSVLISPICKFRGLSTRSDGTRSPSTLSARVLVNLPSVVAPKLVPVPLPEI